MSIIEIIFILLILVVIIYFTGWAGKTPTGTEMKTSGTVENFNPWLDYSRAYPGTFSYKYGYGPFFRPFYGSWPGNIGYLRSGDYAYIPKYEYLNMWMNGPDGIVVPNSCLVPALISESCVNKKIQETGNLDLSIEKCTVPATVSDSCPSLQNWTGPLTYADNDFLNIRKIV